MCSISIKSTRLTETEFLTTLWYDDKCQLFKRYNFWIDHHMNISNCVRFDSVKIWTNWSDRYGMYVRCTQFNGFKVTLIERVREKRTKSKNHQQRIVCPTTYNERGFFLSGLTEKKIRSFVRFLKVKYAQCITCLYCVEKPVLLLNLNAHAILYYYVYFIVCVAIF